MRAPCPERASCVRSAGIFGVIALSALAACTRSPAPEPVLQSRCFTVSGSEPAHVEVSAPHSGPLRFMVRPRGISVTATLTLWDGGTVSGSSVVDRFGEIVLVHDVPAREPVSLQVRSRDSFGLSGEVCIQADLIRPLDRTRLAAERAFAAAGEAVLRRDWHAAVRDYRTAARLFEGIDSRRAAAARHALAQLTYAQLDRGRDSYLLATRALSLLERKGDPGWRGALVLMQARAALKARQAGAASISSQQILALLDRAESLADSVPYGAREVPRIETLRGYMHYVAGDSGKAAAQFERVAAQCQSLGDWECYARARQNLAALAEESHSYSAALEAYRDALAHLSADVAPELAADIWTNFGRLQGTVGLFSQSEKSYLQATHLFGLIDECDGARRSLARLGAMLVQVGSIGDALTYLNRAARLSCPKLMAIARRASAPPESDDATFRAELAEAERSLDLRLACRAPLPASRLTQEGKFGVFLALLGMSEAAMLEGRLDIARRCLDGAERYSIDARTDLRLVNASGTERLASGEVRQAVAEFRRAQRLADQARLPESYEHRGLTDLGLARSALLEGRRENARELATRVLRISSSRADINQVAAALEVLAASQHDDPPLAMETLRIAIRLMEHVPIGELDAEKRAIYLATQHQLFAALTDLHVRTAAGEEGTWLAFELAERGRARSLRHAVDTAETPPADGLTPVADYQKLLRQIGDVIDGGEQPAVWTATLNRLGDLLGHGPVHEDLQRETLLNELKRLDAALIEYAAGTEEMFAFVLEGDTLRVQSLGPIEQIDHAAAVLHARLRNPESALTDVRDAARELAKLTLWPITPSITKHRILFVPEGPMHTVPVALLPWSASDPEQLVIHWGEASIIPSAAHLLRTSQTPAASVASRFALIGDPIFRMSEWRRECVEAKPTPQKVSIGRMRSPETWAEALPRLAGARTEVEGIAELLRKARPRGNISFRIGCDATRAALRSAIESGADLVHIATHGYVNALRPRLSALALTREPGDEESSSAFGLLEILDLPVSSRLVVLSACDTSRGRLLPGEGVLGPAQAFLQAGAESVLASYWRVDDASTADFMRSFYRHLLVERLSVGAALRQTQIESSTETPAHVWAAFGLYGRPDATL